MNMNVKVPKYSGSIDQYQFRKVEHIHKQQQITKCRNCFMHVRYVIDDAVLTKSWCVECRPLSQNV